MQKVPTTWYLSAVASSEAKGMGLLQFRYYCLRKRWVLQSLVIDYRQHRYDVDVLFFFMISGKTELVKQVARYIHKDNAKVSGIAKLHQRLGVIITITVFVGRASNV